MRIKSIRKKNKLSIHDLSKKTGLNASYINHLERGLKKNPSKKTMDKLAKGLETTVQELFYK